MSLSTWRRVCPQMSMFHATSRRKRDRRLRYRAWCRGAVGLGGAGALMPARRHVAEAECGIERRAGLLHHGRGLVEGGLGGGDVLVVDVDLAQKPIEPLIAVDGPPIAALYAVARGGDLPAFELLELGRHRGWWRHVVGPDRAGSQRHCKNSGREGRFRCRADAGLQGAEAHRGYRRGLRRWCCNGLQGRRRILDCVCVDWTSRRTASFAVRLCPAVALLLRP